MANYVSKSLIPDPQDKKKVITPEKIYQSLVELNKSKIWGGIILGVAFLIVALLFVFIINMSDMEEKWAVLVKSLLLAVPVVVLLAFLISYWRGIKKLENGGFAVITDTAERVVTDDRMVRRHSGSTTTYYMEHAMYMYRCGRVVISLEETYIYNDGDLFYVVVPNKDSNTPIFMYNSKYYELEDIEIQ